MSEVWSRLTTVNVNGNDYNYSLVDGTISNVLGIMTSLLVIVSHSL